MSIATITLGDLKSYILNPSNFFKNFDKNTIKVYLDYNNSGYRTYGFLLSNIKIIDNNIVISFVGHGEHSSVKTKDLITELVYVQNLLNEYNNDNLPVLLYDINANKYFGIKDIEIDDNYKKYFGLFTINLQ